MKMTTALAEEQEVQDVLALVRDRLALHELLELRERDEAARERDAAEQDLEAERRDLERAEVLAVPEELRDADEGRREAAERVRERRPLRHGRHRDPEAHRDADRRAREEPDDDPLVAHDVVVEQRADDGEQHPELGHEHAAPGRVGMAQALEAEDEEDRGGEVGELDEQGLRAHFFSRLGPASLRA